MLRENPQIQIQKSLVQANEFIHLDKFEEAYELYSQTKKQFDSSSYIYNYEFYLNLAIACQKTTRYRESILNYRKALSFEITPLERSQIYLNLCRIYRSLILMKNARLELIRAFKAIKEPYPKNSITSLIASVLNYLIGVIRTPRIGSIKKDAEIEHKVALYEEAGLSAYYLRETNPLFQCMFRVRELVCKLGPSIQLLDWYGGKGAVYGIAGLRKKNENINKLMNELVEKIQQPRAFGKALVWKGFAQDYLGNPVQSAKHLATTINKYGKDLDNSEFQTSCTTIACNLNLRGHMEESIQYTELLSERNQGQEKDWSGRSNLNWYSAPAYTFWVR